MTYLNITTLSLKTLSQSKVLPSWKLLFTISLFLSITGFSQSITIVDSTSGEPIEDVLVYTNSSEITAVSDKRGKVNLNSFADDEFLIFNHAAYVTVYLKKSEINTKENFLLAKADNVLPQAYIDHPLRYFLVEDDEAAQIETIPIEIVRLENPESSADMLQNTGNVLVQKSQGGGGSPMIRGFEANKLLLVIDGVRMNNAIYRSGHLQNAITVDNSVLDHTEIIFGPSSSLYGSDALGGVIHFHTADQLYGKGVGGRRYEVKPIRRKSGCHDRNDPYPIFKPSGLRVKA